MENLNNNTDELKNKKIKKEAKPKKEKKEKKIKFSFPDAVNSEAVSVGTGHLWDEVLEYRVYENNSLKSFPTYKEADELASKSNLKVKVLIQQKANHWIAETPAGVTIGTEDRITEWDAEMLVATKYSLPRLKRIFLKIVKDTAKDTLNKLIAQFETKKKEVKA